MVRQIGMLLLLKVLKGKPQVTGICVPEIRHLIEKNMYVHLYINTAFQNTSTVLGISFRYVLYLRTLFLVIVLYFFRF